MITCKHHFISLGPEGGHHCVSCGHEFIPWDAKPDPQWIEAKKKEKMLKEFYSGEEYEKLTGEKKEDSKLLDFQENKNCCENCARMYGKCSKCLIKPLEKIRDRLHCMDCGASKEEWNGLLCKECRAALEFKNIHGDRYDRKEEQQFRKEVLLWLASYVDFHSTYPLGKIEAMKKKFLC